MKIPFRLKLGYGVGNVGYSLPYQFAAGFFMLYATEILKLPPAMAGGIGALSIVWDAVADPVAGALSDHTEGGRLGRRHPYLIAGGLAIAGLSYFLWTIPPSANFIFRVVSIVVCLLLLKTAFALYFVPYLALGGELSRDYDERSSIQGVRAAFYLLGMLLAIGGIPLMFFRSTPEFPRGQLNPAAYPSLALASSGVVLLAALLCFWATRRSIPLLPQRTPEMRRQGLTIRSLRMGFQEAVKNQEFATLILMIFILEAGFQFGIGISNHVNTYTYNLSGPQIGLLGLTVLGSSILSQPFWVWFTKRFEKKTALLLGMAIAFVGFVGAPWTHVWWKVFPVAGPHIVFTLGLFMFIAGIGNGAFMSLPSAMIADAADLEELRTGKRDEGLYFGIYNLAYKVGMALSWMFAGGALSLIGFIPGSSMQTETVKFRLAMMPTYLNLLVGFLAILVISRYGITRARSRETQAALAARGAGA